MILECPENGRLSDTLRANKKDLEGLDDGAEMHRFVEPFEDEIRALVADGFRRRNH